MIKNFLIALGIILILLSFMCCTQHDKCKYNCQRKYTFIVIYYDDNIDTIKYTPKKTGATYYTLNKGDLQMLIYGHTVVSYVKKFRVLDIDTIHSACLK